MEFVVPPLSMAIASEGKSAMPRKTHLSVTTRLSPFLPRNCARSACAAVRPSVTSHASALWTESYISRLENGAIAPGIDLVARLARALASSPDRRTAARRQLRRRTTHQSVATEQAKRLFAAVASQAQDPSFVFLLVQFLGPAGGSGRTATVTRVVAQSCPLRLSLAPSKWIPRLGRSAGLALGRPWRYQLNTVLPAPPPLPHRTASRSAAGTCSARALRPPARAARHASACVSAGGCAPGRWR